jgi:hypothetical protein
MVSSWGQLLTRQKVALHRSLRAAIHDYFIFALPKRKGGEDVLCIFCYSRQYYINFSSADLTYKSYHFGQYALTIKVGQSRAYNNTY